MKTQSVQPLPQATHSTPLAKQSELKTISSSPSDQELIQADLSEMIHFATTRGIPLPPDVLLNNEADKTTLIASYNSMIKVIEPATIQSIRYINKKILGEDGEDRKWFETPIITKCLVIAVIALVCMIGISLFPSVNQANQQAGLLKSDGLVLFYNLIFICSASLLGVMFYLLKTLSNKIKNYTLLPIDSIDVNATILIGVIAGFIISELFTFKSGALGSSIVMQKMTLALLGGFSSDALFSVLKGIVNKMKSLFSSNSAD